MKAPEVGQNFGAHFEGGGGGGIGSGRGKVANLGGVGCSGSPGVRGVFLRGTEEG